MSQEEKEPSEIKTAVKEASFILVCFVCVVLIILCMFYIFDSSFRDRISPNKNLFPSSSSSAVTSDSTSTSEDKPTSPIDFYFIDMENGHYGDAIYVKAGDNDILIDGGNSTDSSDVIRGIISQHCTDKKLEYVFATSCTKEHIGSFYVQDDPLSIFSYYKIDNLIDFGDMVTGTSGNSTYANYLDGIEVLKEKGTNIYSAYDCFNNQNGGKREYSLGTNLSVELLNNKYYDSSIKSTGNDATLAKPIDDYSLVLMFNQEKNHFYFGGDISAELEEDILAKFPDDHNGSAFPNCILYRADKYGAYSSSSANFLKAISPTYCIITGVGSEVTDTRPAYCYPSQGFIKRISKYTSKVYMPSYINEKGQSAKLNGHITVSANSSLGVTLNCEASNSFLKDTEWFKANRTWPNT